MTNEFPSPATGLIASLAQGDVVPIPSEPSDVNVDVAVPPKNALVAERSVVDALPLNSMREVVAD